MRKYSKKVLYPFVLQDELVKLTGIPPSDSYAFVFLLVLNGHGSLHRRRIIGLESQITTSCSIHYTFS